MTETVSPSQGRVFTISSLPRGGEVRGTNQDQFRLIPWPPPRHGIALLPSTAATIGLDLDQSHSAHNQLVSE